MVSNIERAVIDPNRPAATDRRRYQALSQPWNGANSLGDGGNGLFRVERRHAVEHQDGTHLHGS
ncbi:MAG: hypothetical protein JWN46_1349 [Acidimicrobiales bacterium]|nr:hypothetical protein [Acidimicrobiales bacterium]